MVAAVNVRELRKEMDDLCIAGHGDLPVFASADDEGNGFHAVNEHSVRPFNDEYLEEYGWDDDLPDRDVVILW